MCTRQWEKSHKWRARSGQSLISPHGQGQVKPKPFLFWKVCLTCPWVSNKNKVPKKTWLQGRKMNKKCVSSWNTFGTITSLTSAKFTHFGIQTTINFPKKEHVSEIKNHAKTTSNPQHPDFRRNQNGFVRGPHRDSVQSQDGRPNDIWKPRSEECKDCWKKSLLVCCFLWSDWNWNNSLSLVFLLFFVLPFGPTVRFFKVSWQHTCSKGNQNHNMEWNMFTWRNV